MIHILFFVIQRDFKNSFSRIEIKDKYSLISVAGDAVKRCELSDDLDGNLLKACQFVRDATSAERLQLLQQVEFGLRAPFFYDWTIFSQWWSVSTFFSDDIYSFFFTRSGKKVLPAIFSSIVIKHRVIVITDWRCLGRWGQDHFQTLQHFTSGRGQDGKFDFFSFWINKKNEFAGSVQRLEVRGGKLRFDGESMAQFVG